MIRLTDEQWERIRDHFPEENIADGRPGRKPTPTRAISRRCVNIGEVRVAVAAARGRADRDKDRGGVGHGLFEVGGEIETVLARIGFDHAVEAIRCAARPRSWPRVLVDAGDMVAEICKTRARNETNISRPDYGYPHSPLAIISQRRRGGRNRSLRAKSGDNGIEFCSQAFDFQHIEKADFQGKFFDSCDDGKGRIESRPRRVRAVFGIFLPHSRAPARRNDSTWQTEYGYHGWATAVRVATQRHRKPRSLAGPCDVGVKHLVAPAGTRATRVQVPRHQMVST
jgi:hypothetical protein